MNDSLLPVILNLKEKYADKPAISQYITVPLPFKGDFLAWAQDLPADVLHNLGPNTRSFKIHGVTVRLLHSHEAKIEMVSTWIEDKEQKSETAIIYRYVENKLEAFDYNSARKALLDAGFYKSKEYGVLDKAYTHFEHAYGGQFLLIRQPSFGALKTSVYQEVNQAMFEVVMEGMKDQQ